MAKALLGLGGNLGEVPATIAAALGRLEAAGIEILAASSLFRTPPWGPVEQPDFVNACALLGTALAPLELLAETQGVERALGRRGGERYGPRVIDLDILAYEGIECALPDLVLPHPRLTERAFVLVPLAEIVPDWLVSGRPVRDWVADVDGQGISRLGDSH